MMMPSLILLILVRKMIFLVMVFSYLPAIRLGKMMENVTTFIGTKNVFQTLKDLLMI